MTRDELYDLYFDTKIENDKLRALACYLYYVNPRDIDVIDALMREVGLKVEDTDNLDRETATLRELAHLVLMYVSADQCEGCVTKRACNDGELDMCWIRKAIIEKQHELFGYDG